MIEAPLSEWDGEPVTLLRSRWDVPVLEAYGRIGSTNDRAAELAASSCGPYAVVVAEEQSAGRGRRGATWSSPPACGLWMSVVLPASVPSGLAFLPLLVGLATADAIEEAGSGVEVKIKWPNDLWVGGRKVAGVLCESAGAAVVAGVGINLTPPVGGFPADLTELATSLETVGANSLIRSELALRVVTALKRHVEGLSSVLPGEALAELGRRDALVGRPIDTDQSGEGIARGIAEDGALILERSDGSRVPVVVGSVRLR